MRNKHTSGPLAGIEHSSTAHHVYAYITGLFYTLKCVQREREMFYLTTHLTHFIYGYMASDIWLRTILIVRKETRCRHICYSYRLTARVLLYAPFHRQDNTYHGLCYTSRGALAVMRNSLNVLSESLNNYYYLKRIAGCHSLVPSSRNSVREPVLFHPSWCLEFGMHIFRNGKLSKNMF